MLGSDPEATTLTTLTRTVSTPVDKTRAIKYSQLSKNGFRGSRKWFRNYVSLENRAS